MKPINVVLADDHPLLMAGFAMSLEDYGIKVVGQAKTPDGATAKYLALKPDVLVLDIRFGEKLTGLNAAKNLLEKSPKAKIVFLSQFDQDSLIKEAYRLGGYAFVTKDRDAEELANAIRSAAEGKLYFLPEVAERLASLSIHGDTSPQSQLEEREVEIFTLMAQGLTNQEIADQLDLSPKTISNISQSIKEKLGIHRAADITRLAVKHGLIEP
jgi:two-component system invasion response regulator UvrY